MAAAGGDEHAAAATQPLVAPISSLERLYELLDEARSLPIDLDERVASLHALALRVLASTHARPRR